MTKRIEKTYDTWTPAPEPVTESFCDTCETWARDPDWHRERGHIVKPSTERPFRPLAIGVRPAEGR